MGLWLLATLLLVMLVWYSVFTALVNAATISERVAVVERDVMNHSGELELGRAFTGQAVDRLARIETKLDDLTYWNHWQLGILGSLIVGFAGWKFWRK